MNQTNADGVSVLEFGLWNNNKNNNLNEKVKEIWNLYEQSGRRVEQYILLRMKNTIFLDEKFARETNDLKFFDMLKFINDRIESENPSKKQKN